ncbi:NAD-dependent epimerase/dehydratase family protein [Thalassobellus suaedae]|uniref:NAD(P)-dependent oxidoreductase n=1 Tax=Thalassobellus suaedae TaxID=3074124 RepID=A0ABY9Y7A5_9FLAO|nr:NAD(P)-dependent oxidoreductase [Flavobacteriaceae bacterium HL-DH10]
MNKIAILFGGSGYIGTNLIKHFISLNRFDKYIIADIKKPKEIFQNNKVSFVNVDVREDINIGLEPFEKGESWIFNLAAIHREPGHDYKEYFDTNVPGAKNINDFARISGLQNMFFTSSIAPYGKSLEQRTEKSMIYPETAYGISKALAEKIHQKWLSENTERRLVIVRPSVIFGPKDPGNVYRMIRALKKGSFILPNGGDIIKGYGYVYGLVESILFTMDKKENLIVYNYAESELIPLKEMVSIVKKELNYNRPTVKMGVNVLAFIAFFIQIGSKLFGFKSDIHPTRVKKAGFPTNIKSQYLIDNGFVFRYNFLNALRHWKELAPEDFN